MKALTPKAPQGADPVFQIWLDGVRELVACWDLPAHATNEHLALLQRGALNRGVPSFFGVASEAEARAVLKAGYPAGLAKVQEVAASLASALPPPKSRRRLLHWGDDGDEYNWERGQRDLPAWRSSKRQLRRSTGLVELVVDWGGGCGVTPQALMWAPALLLALSDALERADYQTEVVLVAGMCSNDGGRRARNCFSLLRLTLKQAGEPMVPEALAAVVHPAAWRVYALKAFCLSPFPVGSGYHSHPHCPILSPGLPPEPAVPLANLYGWRRDVLTLALPQVYKPEHATEVGRWALGEVAKYVAGERS